MKILSVAGDRVVILLGGEETGQQYTVQEATIPPGAGPPPHVHSREDETFLVLEGEITFHIGERLVVLKKGEFLFAPRGVPHYFKNTGTTEAVMLETATPSGLEGFLEATGMPHSSRQDKPAPLSPADISRMRELAPDYGITILSPAEMAALTAKKS